MMVFQTDSVQEIIRDMFSEAIFKALNMEMGSSMSRKRGKTMAVRNYQENVFEFFY